MIFDVASFVVNKRKFLKATTSQKAQKTISLLSSAVSEDLADWLKIFCHQSGFCIDIKTYEFGKWDEIALYEPQRINNSDVCIIWTGQRDFDKSIDRWQNCYEKIKIPIIQTNFELPLLRPRGNFEGTNGKVRETRNANEEFAKLTNQKQSFYICDQEYISSYIGLDNWYDEKLWTLYKIGVSQKGLLALAYNIAKIICAMFGQSKKAVAIDLDNTLWGGVVGDDGAQNLQICHDDAISQGFESFQKYLKNLNKSGIMLAINSKNDENIVKNAFCELKMSLGFDDFSSKSINWERKDINLQNIAKDLNIGLDFIVFIDDNPAEIELIKSSFSNVETLNICGDSYDFAKQLDLKNYFETLHLSTEDLLRVQNFNANSKRAEQEIKFENYDEYLQSLQMIANFSEIKSSENARVVQLINKTNQFNLTTKRSNDIQALSMLEDKNRINIAARFKDKFGDYGLISFASGIIEKNILTIDFWLMSCRVFKRGLELAVFNEILKQANQKNIVQIIGLYKQTQKNELVKDWYKSLGFVQNGDLWQIKTMDTNMQKHFIEVVYE